MNVYLVGGAVRDQLLGLACQERDYVVVGETVENMLKAGFLPVGKSFPVFLHPQDKSEYALARSEKKTGQGYHAFECIADPTVSLEEDLKRRDLTINAMAMDKQGRIVDPYGGQADLQQRVLRHVSSAFSEDPVRLLRTARFAARFHSLGFYVHADTLQLMRDMVAAGEVNALVAERVFKETLKALGESAPWVYFEVLRDSHALAILFPELVPQLTARLNALHRATDLTHDTAVRWASMTAICSAAEIKQLAQRYKLPTDIAQLALLVSQSHADFTRAVPQSGTAWVALLNQMDAFRRPERFTQALQSISVWLSPDSKLPQQAQQIQAQAAAVDIQRIIQQNTPGPQIKATIDGARALAIDEFLKNE